MRLTTPARPHRAARPRRSGPAVLAAVALAACAAAQLAALPAASAAVRTSPATALYSWGSNHSGQLGSRDAPRITTSPVRVGLPAGVRATAVAAGQNMAYARTSSGAIFAWGDNSRGQLGAGQAGLSTTPVKVPLPGGFTPAQITGGAISAYAASAAGQVYGWGSNSLGQLGTTPLTGISPPVLVGLPHGIAAAALIPEPVSESGYAIAGPAGLKSRTPTVSTTVTFRVGGPGPIIHVQGGGGGRDHSNCTDDETTRTVEAQSDPVSIRVSFDAKWWGECNSEPSYSYFDVTVTGKDAAGRTMNSRGRFWLGQDSAGGQYYVECSEPEVRLTCMEHPISFQAFPG
jgi:hypothetical protein